MVEVGWLSVEPGGEMEVEAAGVVEVGAAESGRKAEFEFEEAGIAADAGRGVQEARDPVGKQ